MDTVESLEKRLNDLEKKCRASIGNVFLLMNSVSWAIITALILCDASVIQIMVSSYCGRLALIVALVSFSFSLCLSIAINLIEAKMKTYDTNAYLKSFLIENAPQLTKVYERGLQKNTIIEIIEKFRKLGKFVFNSYMEKKQNWNKALNICAYANIVIWTCGFVIFVIMTLCYVFEKSQLK
ncbi:MAG: hypothetical protein IJI37_07905 [Opitutales bacterium]|nr:hypothetical protein [Opitutales bacterium]